MNYFFYFTKTFTAPFSNNSYQNTTFVHAHAFEIFNWKIWQRRTFFSPSPLEFHNFFRVFRLLDELSITIDDYKVMSHTGATN